MAKVQPDVIGTDDAQTPAVEAGKLNVCMCSEATQAKVVAFFDHTYTSIAMGIFTIYSLIGDDLLHLSRGAGPDVTHQWLCLFMFIAFGAEWVSFCFCKPKFMWSFFFYLDFVATASLILDFAPLFATEEPPDVGDSAGMAKAGRAARIGTRTGRLVRLFRLFRLFKLLKLAKKAQGDDDVDLSEPTEEVKPSAVGAKLGELTTNKVVLGVMAMLVVIPFLEASDPDQSISMGLTLIGAIGFEDGGARRSAEVAALVRDYPTIMFLNLSVPDSTERKYHFFDSVNFKGEGCATQLDYCSKNPDLCTTEKCDKVAISDVDGAKKHCMCPEYLFKVYRFTGDPSEVSPITSNSVNENEISLALVDKFHGLGGFGCADASITNISKCPENQRITGEGGSKAVAELNLLKTLFIVILLGGGSAMFTSDATSIAVGPIERMVKVVETLAKNPLGDLNDPEEAAAAEARKKNEIEVPEADQKKGIMALCTKKKTDDPNSNADETKMLANSIKNIGGLLQKGFGAAGAKIITSNLQSADEGLDVVRPGTSIDAIYGFCDIRQFTDTTECILAQIMGFVNMSADVVHGITVEHYGAPNKNVGDAFLLVWRFDEGTAENPGEVQGPQGSWGKSFRTRTECADGALMAYHEMVCHLKNHKALNEINKHAALERRFNPDGTSPYMIRLGCGLHVGRSVEGAIGTEQKVDCSYLGLPVKVPERLQDGMKIYKSWILMSKDFWVLLSKQKRDMTRVLDIVDIEGNFAEPRHPDRKEGEAPRAFTMYTHDVIPELCDESNHPFYSKIPVEEHSGLRPFGERNGPNKTMISYSKKNDDWKNTDYKNPEAYERIAPKHMQFCRDYEKALGFFLGRVDKNETLPDGSPNPSFGKPDQNAPYVDADCDWQRAKQLFEELSDGSQAKSPWLWKEDLGVGGGPHKDGWESIGPSRVMLKWMESKNYQKPADWDGIHWDEI